MPLQSRSWLVLAVFTFFLFLIELFSDLSILPTNRKPTKKHSTSPEECLEKRGYEGTWVRDWDYARETYYDIQNPTSLYEPTDDAPFRWETSWRWNDDVCEMHVITREGLCQVCEDLGLTRILTGGDSLSESFYLSLLGLIGEPRPFTQHYGEIEISCPENVNNLTLLCARFDKNPYEPTRALSTYHKETIYQKDFTPFIKENPKGTALTLNVGAHFGPLVQHDGIQSFEKGISHLLEWIQEMARPDKDLVFFRSTVPGHPHCQRQHNTTKEGYRRGFRVAPIHNYGDWERWNRTVMLSVEASMYRHFGWQYFEYFNNYTKEMLEDASLPVYWINTWHSTVLRRDGHIGFNGFFNDCLHYYPPGPTDWWVHMWFSQLKDLAAVRARNK